MNFPYAEDVWVVIHYYPHVNLKQGLVTLLTNENSRILKSYGFCVNMPLGPRVKGHDHVVLRALDSHPKVVALKCYVGICFKSTF